MLPFHIGSAHVLAIDLPELLLVLRELELIHRVYHHRYQRQQLNLLRKPILHYLLLVLLPEQLELLYILLHQLEYLLIDALLIEIKQVTFGNYLMVLFQLGVLVYVIQQRLFNGQFQFEPLVDCDYESFDISVYNQTIQTLRHFASESFLRDQLKHVLHIHGCAFKHLFKHGFMLLPPLQSEEMDQQVLFNLAFDNEQRYHLCHHVHVLNHLPEIIVQHVVHSFLVSVTHQLAT